MVRVVGAVIVREGRILCAQRGEKMSLPLKWEFPGGKIEAGETPQHALQREIQEEMKCRVEIGDQIESTTYEYDFGTVQKMKNIILHLEELEISHVLRSIHSWGESRYM